jgi:hypothetical protein
VVRTLHTSPTPTWRTNDDLLTQLTTLDDEAVVEEFFCVVEEFF